MSFLPQRDRPPCRSRRAGPRQPKRKPVIRIILAILEAGLIAASLVAYSNQETEIANLKKFTAALDQVDRGAARTLTTVRNYLTTVRSLVASDSQAIGKAVNDWYP